MMLDVDEDVDEERAREEGRKDDSEAKETRENLEAGDRGITPKTR